MNTMFTGTTPSMKGISTTALRGMNMMHRTNIMAIELTTASILRLDTRPPMAPPISRPHIIRNQYMPISTPASLAVRPRPSLTEPSSTPCAFS